MITLKTTNLLVIKSIIKATIIIMKASDTKSTACKRFNNSRKYFIISL